MVTAEEADRIYVKNKYINEETTIEWKTVPYTDYAYKLSVPVITEDGEELVLKGNYSRKRRGGGINYSFVLLYRNTVKIRRWDMSPNEYKKAASHKHKWDGYTDYETYLVDDICLCDVNQAFHDFLIECNIIFEGKYINIM